MKKAVCICVIIFFGFLFTSTAWGQEDDKQLFLDEAEHLRILGVFQGTENGFELERAPTRVEGAVMLIRLLGKEMEAKESNYVHPFKDVPPWADHYIGYMYQMGLTSGMSAEIYGALDSMTANQYGTFILRALGYDDQADDFLWDHALEMLVKINIIESIQASKGLIDKGFLRNQMVWISYNALQAHLKDTDISLIQHLSSEGAISVEAMNELNIKLTSAVDHGDWDEVYRLIKYGADPNGTRQYANDPVVLQLVREAMKEPFTEEFYDILENLLKLGLDPNSSFMVTHLIGASDDYQFIELLLAYGADPNLHKPKHYPVLVNAVKKRDVRLIKLLVQYGADLEPELLEPVIFHAIRGSTYGDEYRYPSYITVKLLLELGADPKATYMNVTALEAANQSPVVTLYNEFDENGNHKQFTIPPNPKIIDILTQYINK